MYSVTDIACSAVTDKRRCLEFQTTRGEGVLTAGPFDQDFVRTIGERALQLGRVCIVRSESVLARVIMETLMKEARKPLFCKV